jgi:serine/threonine protein phosphatase PrpC
MTAGSVIGSRYDRNYDKMRTGPRLAVIADGMGDGDGSDVAGTTAVDVFGGLARPDAAALRAAVAEVQRRVIEAGRGLPGLAGCTLTGFVAGDDDAWIVQLGDSRAYRLRDGLLELLTVDHTAAWLGILHGWYAHDSARAKADRYRLHRFAGHPDAPEPDLLTVALRPGDRFLLCTDGVADQVSYARMLAALDAGDVERLLADSLAAGGNDNATAVMIRVQPNPAEPRR